jgi:hypothetical protein
MFLGANYGATTENTPERLESRSTDERGPSLVGSLGLS